MLMRPSEQTRGSASEEVDEKRKRRKANRDKHHRLQKLVDNGGQLDHANEAKLNKLVAARRKNNNHKRESYQNNRDERHRLQKLLDERWTCKV
jgi:hypothetical protein